MASPNGRESAVEMCLDSADRQTGDAGDLGELKLLQKPEKEDASLALRELRNTLPHQGHLFAGDQARLKRTIAMRNVGRDVGYINGRVRNPFPEAETVGSRVIAHQVQRDPHQPGRDRTITAEAVARRPRSYKRVLGQRLRYIAIPDRDQMEPEDPLFIGSDDRVHIVERSSRRLLRDERLALGGETIGSESL
jgi:hypothetical protein